MLAHSLFFYFFSSIAVFFALMVAISKNTVYSVFFLILVFVSISILFIMIGAEFLGMVMLIVYVGAVAVLFLFVVMMLNVTETKPKQISRKGFINNISVGSIVGIIIFLELLVVVGGWKYKGNFVQLNDLNISTEITNTHALGIILLVAMIGAITLTFRKRENIKRQNYFTQIQREKDTAVSLVEVESNKGVILDD